MQFARKAGKLVSGFEATLRAVNKNQVYLIVTAEDTSDRTEKNLQAQLELAVRKLPRISFGTQAGFGQALGLPPVAVLGVIDKNFATRIHEYWQAED